MHRHLLARSVTLALLTLGAGGCGARTGLSVPDPCPSQGTERTCQDGCGTGTQVCNDGFWSQCNVAVSTRSCADDCGAGEQSCVEGHWQACQVPDTQRDCASTCGPGHETCRNGSWGACDAAQPRPPQLRATIRDFSSTTHPDFEAAYPPGLDKGIVADRLGVDDTPDYAGMPRTPSTSGVANFQTWYHDAPINVAAPLDLQLAESNDDPGQFVYDDHDFFPIDNQLIGNEGRHHNFHFTLQASTTFEYRGGEVFSFSGDDDMWVFINRRLAIDLGGAHSSLSAKVALDDFAGIAGLMPGGVYPLHFFFAERHTSASNFTLRTSIAEPGSCD